MQMNKVNAEDNKPEGGLVKMAGDQNGGKIDIDDVKTVDANDTITWSQISEPGFVSDDEEKKRDAMPKGWCTKKKIRCYIILGVILLVVIVLILLRNLITKKFLDWLLNNVERLAQSETFGAYAFFIGFQCAFSWFVLPGLSYFNIIMSFFMKNFIKAWLIATFGSWCAAVALFLLIRCCLFKRLEKKFKDNALYKVLRSEVKKNPWKTSTFINILFIPTAFKNYTIPLTSLKLYQYMIPSLPFYAFFSGMLCLIGSQISDIDEISNQGFSNMTFAQKVNFILGWVLLVSTFILVCCFGRIAAKKMAQLKKDEKYIRSKKKKTKIRFDKYEKAMSARKYSAPKIKRKLDIVRPELKKNHEGENKA